jgi:hippurate hydrolase
MITLKDQWKGTLVLIAQPAEEIMQGAEAMVQDRIYERGVPEPDFFLGMHTMPYVLGTIDNGFAERTAGSDQLDVTFYGVGGHGSAPQLAKDPIVMAASAILQYQTIISRNIAAQDAAVITVGAVQAGIENNVIPPSALLKLSLRWFNERDRNILLDGIKRINEGIAIANNLPADLYPSIKMKSMVYPVVNNASMVKRINGALAGLVDPSKINNDSPPIMASEDFHHLVMYNKKTVYDFIFIGTANPDLSAKAREQGKKYPFYNHNGNYQVDLAAIPYGTSVGATALLELLKK